MQYLNITFFEAVNKENSEKGKLQRKNQHETLKAQTLWVLQKLSITDLKKTFLERSLEVSGVPLHSPKQRRVAADAM